MSPSGQYHRQTMPDGFLWHGRTALVLPLPKVRLAGRGRRRELCEEHPYVYPLIDTTRMELERLGGHLRYYPDSLLHSHPAENLRGYLAYTVDASQMPQPSDIHFSSPEQWSSILTPGASFSATRPIGSTTHLPLSPWLLLYRPGPVLSRPFTLYFPSAFDLLVIRSYGHSLPISRRSHHKNRMPRLRRGIFKSALSPLCEIWYNGKPERKRASVCVPFPPPPSPMRWQSCVSSQHSPAPRHRLRLDRTRREEPGLLPKRPWACCGTIWSLRAGRTACLSGHGDGLCVFGAGPGGPHPGRL